MLIFFTLFIRLLPAQILLAFNISDPALNIQSSKSRDVVVSERNDYFQISEDSFFRKHEIDSARKDGLLITGSESGDPYNWPAYHPTLNYNFRQEYPELQAPTQELDDCEGVVGSISSGWWTFKWGPNANPLVAYDTVAITALLDRMNTDFAYFRDSMGWPPDKRAKHGYRSAIYLYGSGLCTDNAPNTATGGWQSSITYNGESWPMVLISYYPVYCFDPNCTFSDKEYQKGACVHEGIHSVLADLPGCKKAAWFHEGGNTWLQQEAEARRTGDYSTMGYLNGCTFLAPFMPIECYSGWLQDDSFGGPSAEGVNKTDENGQQLCTWRNYLGGTQYGNAFPVFLGLALGQGSIPWIWRYCTGRVLQGMADTLGATQIRRLIMEYRAKQALLDMGPWTNAIKKILDSYFGITIKAEWQPSWLNPEKWKATPYAKTTIDSNGILTPEWRTTPGWSGANQIPLHVTGNMVSVNFMPIGKNMTCQLCYRDINGNPVYSFPVDSGECRLRLDTPPANGVVFAVISNTDYVYTGEGTRRAHFDYRLKLGEGVTRTANIYLKWYDWTKTIEDPVSDIEDVKFDNLDVRIYPNPIDRNGSIRIDIDKAQNEKVSIKITNIQGKTIYQVITGEDEVIIPCAGKIESGVYIVTLHTESRQRIMKLIVR